MTSQKAETRSGPTDNRNTIASSSEASNVSSSTAHNDDSRVPNNKQSDDIESEEEWEDTAPANLEYRGKQDRPNVGAAQNVGDGGKKRPLK